MNTASCEKEAPSLSRDEAIAILDTPDEELEALIDRASSLRYKYKGNRVSIHILTNAAAVTVPRIVPTVPSHVVPLPILINTNG